MGDSTNQRAGLVIGDSYLTNQLSSLRPVLQSKHNTSGNRDKERPRVGVAHVEVPHVGGPHVGGPHVGMPHVGGQCGVCGKLFRDNWLVRRHMVTHTLEKRHICPHCGKRFANKHGLVQHMRNLHSVAAAILPAMQRDNSGNSRLHPGPIPVYIGHSKLC